MKIIYIITLLTLIPYQDILSQVGINTVNMQKNGTVDCVIQIDPKGNNNITGNPLDSQTTDDILIDAQGRMSVGHIKPTHKLHIKTEGTNIAPIAGLKMEDGSQGNTKLLISDQYGNSSWAYIGETPIVKGVLDPNGIDLLINSNITSNIYFDTKSYIKLPPGRWLVTVNMILNTSGTGTLTSRSWIRSTFRDSPTATESSPDFIPALGRWISGLVYWGAPSVMNGFVILRNSTASVKTYYYSTGYYTLTTNFGSSNSTLLKFGSSSYRQNNILAFKMSDN